MAAARGTRAVVVGPGDMDLESRANSILRQVGTTLFVYWVMLVSLGGRWGLRRLSSKFDFIVGYGECGTLFSIKSTFWNFIIIIGLKIALTVVLKL